MPAGRVQLLPSQPPCADDLSPRPSRESGAPAGDGDKAGLPRSGLRGVKKRSRVPGHCPGLAGSILFQR